MDNEVTNYLLAFNHMKIIQRKDMFNFSLDTVLLANFCTITKDVKKIVDFGTNNAAIPLLLSTRTDKKIIGIEIQLEAVELAKKNVMLNNLSEQIEIIHDDISEYVKNSSKVGLVICNPPFFKVDEDSNINENEFLSIARHEIKIDLEGIIKSAAKILDNRGKFAMVHRPDRFLDILHAMENANIAPKKARFVYPKPGKEANVLLIEGIKQGKKDGFRVLPPLFTYNEKNEYEAEMKAMLYGE